MPTKLVLADKTALDGKYGVDAQKVWDAIDLLIAADANRGIVTSLRLLDPAGATDPVQAKAAIDAALEAPAPDYAVLLGGPDLIAHVPLENPASDDGDKEVPSDLPYACEAPYSTRIADFLAPTRVISRLPDVPGATDPAPLLAALATATAYASRPAAVYAPPLGVTAEVWETSTTLTLTQLFGARAKVHNVPDDGPAWGAGLGSLSHFFNCHGSPSTPTYYGQRAGNYPSAHEAALVDGHVDDGTVLAAECCYGAQLYDPRGGQLGMPFAYLRSGAYAVFGSTTIAYGPADSTAYADVLCRLFLASILAGGSVGRAGLEARQSYVGRSSPMDPIELKTVAQFLVLGDASVHPAQGGGPIGQGRDELARKGGAIGAVTSFAERIEDAGGDIVDLLTSQFAHAAPGEASVASYDIQGGVLSRRLSPGERARIHVVLQTLDMPRAPLAQRIATVGIERFGRLVQVRTAMSR